MKHPRRPRTLNTPRPSPATKAQATLASFMKKVELVELASSSTKPVPPFIPLDVTRLAAWDDPALGVSKWSSWSIVSRSGKYSDLRRRYDKAVLALLERSSAKPPPKRRTTAEVLELKKRVRELSQQNARLAARELDRTTAISMLTTQLESARSELEAARQRLSVLRPRLVDASSPREV